MKLPADKDPIFHLFIEIFVNYSRKFIENKNKNSKDHGFHVTSSSISKKNEQARESLESLCKLSLDIYTFNTMIPQ